MNNRQKIIKFCKSNNIKVCNLEFIRNREYIYGDSIDASYWELICEIDGIREEFDSFYGYTINEDIDIMLEEITQYLRELND
ncbi:MAG: hypothetical protein ACOC33_02595 [bacterium]